MALEIERRFLVRSDHAVWSSNSVRIVQGYIPQSDGGNLRVRIAGDTACLTIKRHVASGVRNEHNMPLTVTVASALLRTRCTGGIVEKVRHTLVIGGRTWEVDVFEGDNEGLTIAEIELDYVGQPFQLPLWVGPEITGDPRYGNSRLARMPYRLWQIPFGPGGIRVVDAKVASGRYQSASEVVHSALRLLEERESLPAKEPLSRE
jgi:adenylate cyclase